MGQTSDSRLTRHNAKVTPEHKAPDGVARRISRAGEGLQASSGSSAYSRETFRGGEVTSAFINPTFILGSNLHARMNKKNKKSE